jgi:hypothetical protein
MRYFEWAVHLRARMRWCGPPASAAWPYSLDSMKSLGLRRPDRAEGKRLMKATLEKAFGYQGDNIRIG